MEEFQRTRILEADREERMLATFELALGRAQERVAVGEDERGRWLDTIKTALVAFLQFIEDEPELGRLLLVDSMTGGERLLRRRAQLLAELAAVVDRGRLEGPAGRRQPPVIAEGVVGAVLAVLQNRLLASPQAEVMDLFGSLVSIIVLPYLGAGVARRELARPAPSVSVAGPIAARGTGSLEYRGGGRVTYRTARVLTAIASYPGASNREVAERAGIADQGQISKLLRRLQARDLITKMSIGQTRGAPNAWRLSERGEAVLNELGELERV